MEYKRIFPAHGDNNTALSVCFSKSELLSMGVQELADELDPEYVGKTEFSKLFSMWKDPLYLAEFFEKNSSFFSDSFWEGVTEDIFVRDVVQYSRLVFKEITRLLQTGQLFSAFESLDSKEESKRKRNKLFKVKAKYGYIAERVARNLSDNGVFDKDSFIDFIAE